MSEDKLGFSGLLEKFEIKDGMDPEHIFPEELPMIAEVRKRCKKSLDKFDWFTDRMIAIFLFARKHDIDRTCELVEAHLAWREKWGYITLDDIPKFKDLNKDLVDSAQQFNPRIGKKQKTALDKYKRKLAYKFAGNVMPHHYKEVKPVLDYFLWFYHVSVDQDPLMVFRHGSTVIQDLKGFGWKNMGFRTNQSFSELQSVFPIRIRQIYVINGGFFFPILMKFAKLVAKAKILRRIETVSADKLLEHIDAEALLEDMGGKLKYGQEDFVKQSEKEEAISQKMRAEFKAKLKEAKEGGSTKKDSKDEPVVTTTPLGDGSDSKKNKNKKKKDRKKKKKAAEANAAKHENDGSDEGSDNE